MSVISNGDVIADNIDGSLDGNLDEDPIPGDSSTPINNRPRKTLGPRKRRVHDIIEHDMEEDCPINDPTFKTKGKNTVKGKKKQDNSSDANPDAAMVNMAQSVSSMARFLKETQKPSMPPVPEKIKSNVMKWADLLGSRVENLPAIPAARLMYKIDGMVLDAQEEAYEEERRAKAQVQSLQENVTGFGGMNMNMSMNPMDMSSKNQNMC